MFLLLISIIVIPFILYKLLLYYLSSNDDYWPKLGVPVALSTEFASYFEILLGKVNFQDLDLKFYNKFQNQNARFIGLMEMRTPTLQLRDLELIKRVYIKDFEYFVNRRSFKFGDELNDNFLFNMHNQEWKDLRSVMSPTFTTGKIRRMFEHFDNSGRNLVACAKNQNKIGSGVKAEIDLRELFGRYTMDVISSSAFGVNSQCLLDDNSVFMKMGKKLQEFNLIRSIRAFFIIFLPSLSELFGISFFNREAMAFFKKIVRNALKYREENKEETKGTVDFLQLMIEARAKDDNKEDKDLNDELDTFEKDAQLKGNNGLLISKSSKITLTDKAILANSVTFFLAGFETTESLLTFVTYHLAIYPDIQERLRNEIQECSKDDDGGKITYEAVNKMNYLEMIVSETLRLYPPATRTERRVTKPYKIPDSDITLPKDTIVSFPIYGIHRDEKIFPDPEKFDPERFSPENKAKRNPYAFMPFGHGPRNCIGMRFALFETKAAIAHLIKNFELSPCADTYIPLKLENVAGNLKPAKGLKVSFKPL